jgi:hypothetical protein
VVGPAFADDRQAAAEDGSWAVAADDLELAAVDDRQAAAGDDSWVAAADDLELAAVDDMELAAGDDRQAAAGDGSWVAVAGDMRAGPAADFEAPADFGVVEERCSASAVAGQVIDGPAVYEIPSCSAQMLRSRRPARAAQRQFPMQLSRPPISFAPQLYIS